MPATTRSKALIGVVAQVLHVVDGGVQDVFAILKSPRAQPAIGPMKGAPEMVSAAEAAIMATIVGIIDQVVRENGADHQNFVLESINKQRPDGPVDQARGQRLFFGWTGFALEETTGDLTGGIVFLVVVDGQREEILTLFLLPWRNVTFAITEVSP